MDKRNWKYSEVKQIEKLSKAGWNNKKLSEKFNATYKQIDAIKNRNDIVKVDVKQAEKDWFNISNTLYDWNKVKRRLYKLYDKNKLTQSKIRKDNKLPSYMTILRHLGGIKTIKYIFYNYGRESLEGKFLPKICRDCSENYGVCGNKPKRCKKEASLYNDLYDTNNVFHYATGKGD